MSPTEADDNGTGRTADGPPPLTNRTLPPVGAGSALAGPADRAISREGQASPTASGALGPDSGSVAPPSGPGSAGRVSRRRVRKREQRGGTTEQPRRSGRSASSRPVEARLPRPTVAERLVVVDRLLDGSVPAAGAVWSRATAWILRIALEQSVDELWARTEPDLARCPMRAQLLALRVIAGPPIAARTAALWTALSHAAHHHDIELAPGVSELRRWREDTARIAGELAAIRR